MKLFKILLIMITCLSLFGCKAKKEKLTKKNNKELTEVPQFYYPDQVYNKYISKDEQNNYYFCYGPNIYQLDKDDNLKVISDCLINNIYLVRDANYYNNKLYLLVLKVNQKYDTNHPLGIATIDLDGNNFQYLNDLSFINYSFTPSIDSFRIYDNKIYIENYYLDTPMVYTYSLKSNTIINADEIENTDKRTNYYLRYFPDYPYKKIEHVYKENFYSFDSLKFYKEGDKIYNFRLVKYNPVTKEEKKYDISNYHKYSGGINSPTIDILDDSCYYISNTGMYKFDINLENFKVILNEDVFFNSYIPLYDDDIITICRYYEK
ncbi:MAG: hypothetical protein ACLSGM_11920 [Thomasclavelia sp.]